MKTLAGSFDRFDIVEAYFLFMVDWQRSPCFGKGERESHGRREPTLQEIGGQLHDMQFRPGLHLRDYASLSENARLFYDALCTRFRYVNPDKEGDT